MTKEKTKFYLNEKLVEANADETIWQVANRLGTEIPHLCYSDKPGYRADGVESSAASDVYKRQ